MFLKRLSLLAVLCVLFAGCTTKSYKSAQDIDNDMYAYQGDATAKQGVRYLFGRGVPQSDEKAFTYFNEAAGKGDKFAQNEVAFLYAAGKGTHKDIKKAFYWYGRAAQAGLASAQFNLGLMYQHGMGTQTNKALAMNWIHKAAAQGFEPAQMLLKSRA